MDAETYKVQPSDDLLRWCVCDSHDVIVAACPDPDVAEYIAWLLTQDSRRRAMARAGLPAGSGLDG